MVATSMLLMKVSILHAIIVTQLAVYNAAFFILWRSAMDYLWLTYRVSSIVVINASANKYLLL